ncbi:MAG: hypothetical protein ACE5KO_02350 [Candidatus Bathyarchaeia archaeon]
MIYEDEYLLLQPCKTDRAYMLTFRKSRYPASEVVRKLKEKHGCPVLAQSNMLTILRLGQVVVSVHSKGDILIREAEDFARVRDTASQILRTMTC